MINVHLLDTDSHEARDCSFLSHSATTTMLNIDGNKLEMLSRITLGDIFTGNEIRGFLEKIPISSPEHYFELHFKIPQINLSVICSKRVKLRCIHQINYFTWSVRQGGTFLRYIES